jgi:hypothetical protein
VSVATSKEIALEADLDPVVVIVTDAGDLLAPALTLEAHHATEGETAEGATPLRGIAETPAIRIGSPGAELLRLARAEAALAATARAAMVLALLLDPSQDLSAAADPSLPET